MKRQTQHKRNLPEEHTALTGYSSRLLFDIGCCWIDAVFAETAVAERVDEC
eukprot:m.195834 g.195834  ORF g.195834 m.195834 type:complete len:51 (-) comp53732_c1_seq1:293-445(-)